jgi:ankyrin repeat protein
MSENKRYVIISPDLATAAGFENLAGAEAAALAFGDGAHVVDTSGTPYHPAVMAVEKGVLEYVGFGSFDSRLGLDANLIWAARKGHPAIVKAFLARGADPAAADDDGGTALHWAVAASSADAVRLLIGAGAPVDTADVRGTTPLALAERKGRDEIARVLKEAGAAA